MRIKILLLLLSLLGFWACEEESIPPPEDQLGTDYYPLEIGNRWIYQVDSVILVAEIGRTRYDSIRVLARETLVDTFNDQSGRLWYRGLREERASTTDAWEPTLSFALRVDERGLYRSEDNLEFQLLAFPLLENQRWDGHAAFDEFRPIAVGGELLDVYAGWDYRLLSIDEPYQLPNGDSYAATLLVDQAEVDNLIDFRRSYRRYAKGIGPIETFVDARHTQCQVCCNGDTGICLDLAWDVKAEKGYIIHQVLLP
ncbi:MAG: hypothetical protein AAF433_10710 [Bacteroidota bacterium]